MRARQTNIGEVFLQAMVQEECHWKVPHQVHSNSIYVGQAFGKSGASNGFIGIWAIKKGDDKSCIWMDDLNQISLYDKKGHFDFP